MWEQSVKQNDQLEPLLAQKFYFTASDGPMFDEVPVFSQDVYDEGFSAGYDSGYEAGSENSPSTNYPKLD